MNTTKKNAHQRHFQLLLIIFCFILCTATLSGCSFSKDNERGTIKKVNISTEDDSDVKAKNIFTRREIPFGYTKQTISNGLAYMKFNAPSGYDVLIDSARHIELDVPDKDSRLHGATMHMLYDYSDYNFSLNGDDTPAEASSYINNFEWELPSMKYNIEGTSYSLRKQALPDEQVNVTNLSKEKNVVTCTVAKDVDLLASTYDPGPSGYSQVTYYYRWQKIPCCISTVVRTDDIDNAKKIIEYIISSITYLPSRIETSETYKVSGSTLTVVEGMVASNNKLVVPIDRTTNASAGIVVGLFDIKTNETAKLTEKTMNTTYAAQMAKSLALSSDYSILAETTSTSDSPNTMAGKKAQHYITNVTFVGESGSENNPLAGTFYGDPCLMTMETLAITENNKQHILCVMYYDVQRQTAKKILSMAAHSVQFNTL